MKLLSFADMEEGGLFPDALLACGRIKSPCKEQYVSIRIPVPWVKRPAPWIVSSKRFPCVLLITWVTRYGPCAYPSGMPIEDFRINLVPEVS